MVTPPNIDPKRKLPWWKVLWQAISEDGFLGALKGLVTGNLGGQSITGAVGVASNILTTIVGDPGALTGLTAVAMFFYGGNNAIYAYELNNNYIKKITTINSAAAGRTKRRRFWEQVKSTLAFFVPFSVGVIMYGLYSFSYSGLADAGYIIVSIMMPMVPLGYRAYYEVRDKLGLIEKDIRNDLLKGIVPDKVVRTENEAQLKNDLTLSSEYKRDQEEQIMGLLKRRVITVLNEKASQLKDETNRVQKELEKRKENLEGVQLEIVQLKKDIVNKTTNINTFVPKVVAGEEVEDTTTNQPTHIKAYNEQLVNLKTELKTQNKNLAQLETLKLSYEKQIIAPEQRIAQLRAEIRQIEDLSGEVKNCQERLLQTLERALVMSEHLSSGAQIRQPRPTSFVQNPVITSGPYLPSTPIILTKPDVHYGATGEQSLDNKDKVRQTPV